jgi:hypothetical protein
VSRKPEIIKKKTWKEAKITNNKENMKNGFLFIS